MSSTDPHGKTDEPSETERASAKQRQPTKRSRIGVLFGGAVAVAAVSAGIGAVVAVTVHHPGSAVDTTATAPSPAPGSIEDVAAKVVPSVVRLETIARGQLQAGSGIVLSADGLIITNAHVVSAAANVGPGTVGPVSARVTFSDGRTAPFSVVGTDPGSDIGVVRCQGIPGLSPIMLGSSTNIRVGQQVVAVGAPLGLQGTGHRGDYQRPGSTCVDRR